MPIAKNFIRARLGFTRTSDKDLLFRARYVLDCMDGNLFLSHPPVSLADVAATFERFSSAVTQCLSRDQRAYVERDKQRLILIGMLRRLGHYAEDNCQNDMGIFLSSGFEAYPTSIAVTEISMPRITNIKQGLTGQLLAYVTPLGRKVKSYELRVAEEGIDLLSDAATKLTVPSVKAPIPIENLTPGKTYACRVRAYFGKHGVTDYSPTVKRMCI